MLEFFRRHRGAFLITLTVIIIVSFSVWGGWKAPSGDPRESANETVFTIYGKDYTGVEAQRLNRNMQLMSMLQMFDLGQGLMMVAQDPETRGNDFVFNLLVLRHEMARLGIHPSDAEAKAELEKLPALQQDGKFDPQRAQMAETNLGMLGMNGQDMLQLMKDNIGFKKLQDLVSKNYVPSPVEVEKAYAARQQTAKISTINFAVEDFKKNVQVTDEEIQKYYDENKEQYMTPERRAVSYVLFENPKDLDKKTPEERAKLETGIVDRVNQFNSASIDPKADFAKIAADLKETVQTVPLFTRDAPPEPIKGESELVEAIFNHARDSRPISDPIKGSKGYYIFTVTELEEPKQQELAAVKDKIKDVLVTQKAEEALGKAVNDARTAIEEGLKANKKIEDLAKELKLTLSPQTELTISEPAQSLPNAYQIASEVETTPAGGLTRPIDVETGALLVYVHAKELRKREDSVALRKNTEESNARMARMRIFSAWFTERRKEADLKLRMPMI